MVYTDDLLAEISLLKAQLKTQDSIIADLEQTVVSLASSIENISQGISLMLQSCDSVSKEMRDLEERLKNGTYNY